MDKKKPIEDDKRLKDAPEQTEENGEDESDPLEKRLLKFGAKFWERIAMSLLSFFAVLIFTSTMTNGRQLEKLEAMLKKRADEIDKNTLLQTKVAALESKLKAIDDRMDRENQSDKAQWELLSRYNHRIQTTEVTADVHTELLRIFGGVRGPQMIHEAEETHSMVEPEPEVGSEPEPIRNPPPQMAAPESRPEGADETEEPKPKPMPAPPKPEIWQPPQMAQEQQRPAEPDMAAQQESSANLLRRMQQLQRGPKDGEDFRKEQMRLNGKAK